MAISSFEAWEVEYFPSSKLRDTLLSQTLKVEEKKVSLFFYYLWPRSRDMAISSFEGSEVKYVKSSKDEMAISRLLGHKS